MSTYYYYYIMTNLFVPIMPLIYVFNNFCLYEYTVLNKCDKMMNRSMTSHQNLYNHSTNN